MRDDAKALYRVRYERHDTPGELKIALTGSYIVERAVARYRQVLARPSTKRVIIEVRHISPWTTAQESALIPSAGEESRPSPPILSVPTNTSQHPERESE